MRRTPSSQRWLKEHHADAFVKQARSEGYRSRAVFKLREIDQRDKLFRPGMVVVDLGAAPGSWTQYAIERVGPKGSVVALDILPVEPLAGVTVIQGDFRDDSVLEMLRAALGERQAGVVMSDMAPNISGISAVDQPRAMHLAELALDLVREVLEPGGALVTKVFQGEGFESYLRDLKQTFQNVHTRKPKASRSRSRELYVVARGYNA